MRPRVRPERYSQVAAAALAMLCIIVLSGSMVRLTGSGLGCDDWPNCNSQKFVDVSSTHAAIEQLNRLFTGLVSLSVVLAVLMAYFRVPRRRDLVLLAWSLVAGVAAQIVIGGIVVLTGLHPLWNMTHFLVSMVLVTCAFLLERSSRLASVSRTWRTVPQGLRRVHAFLLGAAAVAITTGTVVTATGPHAGDENAERLGFELRDVARVHSTSVIICVALLAWLMWHSARMQGRDVASLRQALGTFAFVAVLQGAIGYAQYFTGVPVLLVGLHIAGATAFWLAACNVAFAPRPDEVLPVSPVR
ncbi:MAG: COX15/CtaA family protein [Actinomycetes bacterium]